MLTQLNSKKLKYNLYCLKLLISAANTIRLLLNQSMNYSYDYFNYIKIILTTYIFIWVQDSTHYRHCIPLNLNTKGSIKDKCSLVLLNIIKQY